MSLNMEVEKMRNKLERAEACIEMLCEMLVSLEKEQKCKCCSVNFRKEESARYHDARDHYIYAFGRNWSVAGIAEFFRFKRSPRSSSS